MISLTEEPLPREIGMLVIKIYDPVTTNTDRKIEDERASVEKEDIK